MNSSELTRYFQCKFNPETKEWRTTLFDKESFKQRSMAIAVKVKGYDKEIYGTTYAFNESEDHKSCWYIDILDGKKKVFKKAKGWRLKAA